MSIYVDTAAFKKASLLHKVDSVAGKCTLANPCIAYDASKAVFSCTVP